MARLLRLAAATVIALSATPTASATHIDRFDRCDRGHDRLHDRIDRDHDRWHRRNAGIDLPGIDFPGHDTLHDRLDHRHDAWHDSRDC